MLTEILYSIIIGPLQLFFEIIFAIANRITMNPGLSIIALSLTMNLLVLPLYMRADKMQTEQGEKEASMRPDVKHIKRVFKGDERMMMLQSYYRHVGFKPLDSLKGSISLFLEIPFFIAAYQFLSHLIILNGVSFGPINDLSKPDGLLLIGGITVNLLPFLMTLINLVSVFIFTKGQSAKSKIQLTVMAVFFLVFLYNSPSGLVFYWTLNNTFSLVKTLLYKLKNPEKVISAIMAAAGALFLIYGIFIFKASAIGLRKRILILVIGLLCFLFTAFLLKKNNIKSGVHLPFNTAATGILPESIFLFLLAGCLIPSALIASSPQEFMDISNLMNPTQFIINTAALSFGLFVLWMGVFYWLTDSSGKPIFELIIFSACVTGLVNYMFFGTGLGVISENLRFENELNFTIKETVVNVIVVVSIVILLTIIKSRFNSITKYVLYTGIFVLISMTFLNVKTINNSYYEISSRSMETNNDTPHFTLSEKGKNVVVFMLDRAMNEYIPYLFNEKPELKEKFAGFTYYPNTISFGGCTNFGTPALFGGYEYTPVEMNKRSKESLESKHNEALKVMPVLFNNNGFKVTVCDPPYAGYEWISDLSIFDDYPEICRYKTQHKGIVDHEIYLDRTIKKKRNMFCYSLMKISPVCIQKTIYNDGFYNSNEIISDTDQQIVNNYVAHGMKDSFMDSYDVLCNLSKMTVIGPSDINTFLSIDNDTTHEPMMLQEPEYEPRLNIDNTEYELEHSDRFTINNVTLSMNEILQFVHYQSDMAALIKLGEWFDYLRKNDVYDNTRIIIVSDHGRALNHNKDMIFGDESIGEINDLEFVYPLLMVKDFNSKEYAVSEEFMTNGDVPTLATKGIIADPVNPFTGKKINNAEKLSHDQYVIGSNKWDVNENNGNQFLPSSWLSVHDDMRKKENWRIVTKYGILTDYGK